jgi:glycosyltransferase involved in cell wall biosynthesis
VALEVGLCMAVKNEAHNIVACLDPIIDLFAQLFIIDTGSDDDTPAILRDRFGISPVSMPLDEGRCFALADVRNRGFAELGTPWLMTLDADERIDRAALKDLMGLNDADLPAGIFCAWDTVVDESTVIADYKLCMFRDRHRHWGYIHDTAQPGFRFAGDMACWYPGLSLRHFPDPDLAEKKRVYYERRMECAIRRDPEWLRYQWFRGHGAFKQGEMETACASLQLLHDGRPPLFPVESLYASMVLAAIYARRNDYGRCEDILTDALAFHASVADDFEVLVNQPVIAWLNEAQQLAAQRDLADYAPLAFSY